MVGNSITSYPTDRSQVIHVGSEFRDVTDCSCGVLQGSVLARNPVFCRLYRPISPVNSIVLFVFLSQYADDSHDTQLYVALSKKAVNDAVTNLQTVCSRFICGSVKTDSLSTRTNLKRCSCQLHRMLEHRLCH